MVSSIAAHVRKWKYIYIICTLCAVRSLPGVHGRYYGLELKKGNGRLGKQAMDVTSSVNVEESDC